MRVWAGALLLAALTACAPADPAVHAEQQWRACQVSGIPQERVHACSVVIAAASEPQRKAAALIERGAQRAALGEQVRAIADFGRALRIDPNLARAYVERGRIHYDRGDYERAVSDYDAALALQPNMQVALQLRDVALRGAETSQGRIIDLLTRQIERMPNDPALWNNRCWQRAITDDDLDLALADCNEALRLEPRHAAALDSRGLVHFKRGEFAAAIADYDAALAIDPGRGHYLYGRGVSRIRLGDAETGRADIEAAERDEPGIGRTYEEYGVIL